MGGIEVAYLFITFGIIYFFVINFGAFLIRLPPRDWKPHNYKVPISKDEKNMVSLADVSANNAIKTPQFWLLWVVLFCNVTAGIGILETATLMIQGECLESFLNEIFCHVLKRLVPKQLRHSNIKKSFVNIFILLLKLCNSIFVSFQCISVRQSRVYINSLYCSCSMKFH